MIEIKERLFRVGSSTESSKLAGSITASYATEPDSQVILRTVGAGALNQAIKAVIISNQEFSKRGLIAGLVPYFKNFQDSKDETKSVTSIELKIKLAKL